MHSTLPAQVVELSILYLETVMKANNGSAFSLSIDTLTHTKYIGIELLLNSFEQEEISSVYPV